MLFINLINIMIDILVLIYTIIKMIHIHKQSPLKMYSLKNKNKIKILTYNVQRLPYLFRPSVNIDALMNKYDIVCLQENFCNFLGTNKKSYGYNYISPKCPFYKLVDSGLSIHSKIPLKFINFKPFHNLSSVDKLSDKGFLITKIFDFYLVNTHLQAIYSHNDGNVINANNQLNEIVNFCKNYDKIIILGDFNMDLQNTTIQHYNKVITKQPTHWTQMNNIFNNSSAVELSNYEPFYFDGAFYKNLKIKNVNVSRDDILTDHLGVSFDIIIN